jgi:hypothetical protein
MISDCTQLVWVDFHGNYPNIQKHGVLSSSGSLKEAFVAKKKIDSEVGRLELNTTTNVFDFKPSDGSAPIEAAFLNNQAPCVYVWKHWEFNPNKRCIDYCTLPLAQPSNNLAIARYRDEAAQANVVLGININTATRNYDFLCIPSFWPCPDQVGSPMNLNPEPCNDC